MTKKLRPVGPDGFYSDEPEMKKHFKPKKKKPAARAKAGSGVLARSRKRKLDAEIKKAGG